MCAWVEGESTGGREDGSGDTQGPDEEGRPNGALGLVRPGVALGALGMTAHFILTPNS